MPCLLLQVALGEEWATDPATGLNYHVTWSQDDNGSLQVSRHHPLALAAANVDV